jgi:FKBP-type peptidyl-prolyl cis-trans isomerase FkpA
MKSLCLVTASLLVCALLAGCENSETGPSAAVTSFSSVELRLGTGATATAGTTATINFIGWLYSASATDNKGAQFDTGTFSFPVGTTQIISGLSNGVAGMKVGGLRRMVVPPHLAFGPAGAPPAIPPNATLIFDVELLGVE